MTAVFEVWSILVSRPTKPVFKSEDPVEVIRWIRSQPVEERAYNVHPRTENAWTFLGGQMLAHDFISLHREDAIDDLIKRAYKANNIEGLRKDILDLLSGN